MTARSGPTTWPRTPDTTSSWTSRCSGVISATEGRRRRDMRFSNSLSARRQANFQTKLAKDFAGVLAQKRRRAVEGERCIGEIERADDLRHLTRGRMRQFAQHPAMPDLRLGKHLR